MESGQEIYKCVHPSIHPSEWKYKAKKRDWKNGYRNKESKDKDKINMAVFEKI